MSLTAREILIYLAITHNGDYDAILRHASARTEIDYEKVLAVLKEYQGNALTMLDPEYPEYLKRCPRPPLVLFYYGDISLINSTNYSKNLGITGTRKITRYGEKHTTEIIRDLDSEYNIVSGLSMGVSKTAIEAALECGSKIIGVLPSGINSPWPKENGGLCKQIVENGGLILSEYPNDLPPAPTQFIARNRIIAMISNAIFIPEATEGKTGTDVLVHYALMMGKDIMCLPCDVDSSAHGTNQYIKEGAALVSNAEDIKDMMCVFQERRED